MIDGVNVIVLVMVAVGEAVFAEAGVRVGEAVWMAGEYLGVG